MARSVQEPASGRDSDLLLVHGLHGGYDSGLDARCASVLPTRAGCPRRR